MSSETSRRRVVAEGEQRKEGDQEGGNRGNQESGLRSEARRRQGVSRGVSK